MGNKLSKPINHFLFGPPRRILFVLLAIYLLLGGGTAAYLYYNPINGTNQSANPKQESKAKIATESSSPIATASGKEGGDKTTGSNGAKKSSFPTSSGSSPGSTSPLPESPSAIVAFYADSQSDTNEEDQYHQRAVNYILATGANPVFHAGDLMEDGTQDSLNRFNSVTATLRSTRTFYAALGNNDRKEGDPYPYTTPSPLFFANFNFPNNEQWYSVNIGNLHMVVLDSVFSASNPSQINWLVSDLQSAASQSRITGVIYHYPFFSSTVGSYFRDYGVDFVVAGHNHVYNRSVVDGINYFVTTGQSSLGYCLAKIYSTRVQFTAYNSSNNVIETVTFSKR